MILSTSLNEYLLVIEIPKQIIEKIEAVRNAILDKYAICQPKTGKPTIVLARFVLPGYTENQVNYALHHVLTKEPAFNLHLKNFSGYPMHCIYIGIENQYCLLNLIAKIKTVRTALKMKGEAPYFLQDPIIPLVAKMDKDIYLKALADMQQQFFLESIPIQKILLLKRTKGAAKFTVHHQFSLSKAAALRNLQFV